MGELHLVIGPVGAGSFAILGLFLLFVYSFIQLYKGENRLETLILLFGVIGIIAYQYQLEIGPITSSLYITIIWVPLVAINAVLKIRGN